MVFRNQQTRDAESCDEPQSPSVQPTKDSNPATRLSPALAMKKDHMTLLEAALACPQCIVSVIGEHAGEDSDAIFDRKQDIDVIQQCSAYQVARVIALGAAAPGSR